MRLSFVTFEFKAMCIKKAVKATVILFPLLGMAHILLFFKPHQLGEAWEMAYRVIHAIFQASQGILVSVIYCFMNSEVRIAIMKKWRRYKSARMDKGDRRRSSGLARTSTCLIPINGNTDRGNVQSTTRPWTTIV
ncbi:hypothetical protein LSH36_1054g00022 [Paralvinella palmiformis]|uniref:G-protein coupled receptors family 2 profile 2 domain-containing protein n=1 Tax=Paralvinella palmiformis TaxID=53620 RepID=A0AAD9IW51_9ANNE|nr:hypothetical protein LSH36_1054g00022 [Paralvinella palmiformis]